MRWTWRNPERTHAWFAWHPVILSGQWVWLETINRVWSETFCGGQWRYSDHE